MCATAPALIVAYPRLALDGVHLIKGRTKSEIANSSAAVVMSFLVISSR
jgi:hypothetical protein